MIRLSSKNRRILDHVGRFATLIGADARLVGRLTGRDNCLVQGEFHGDCDLDATLLLAVNSRWRGSIVAESVVIAGAVQGNIAALRRVELASTAHVRGSIAAPSVAIATGAVHEGEVWGVTGRPVRFRDRRRGDRYTVSYAR